MLWKDLYRVDTARKVDWDYSSASWYFVTANLDGRNPAFGELLGIDSQPYVELSPLGIVAAKEWLDIPNFYTDVVLDAWIVMPDHFHALLWLDGTPLGQIMNRFKGRVTKANNEKGLAEFIWQERFHDEIVPKSDHLDCVRHYIFSNPQRTAEKMRARRDDRRAS